MCKSYVVPYAKERIGLLTSIVGGVQKTHDAPHYICGGLLTSIVGGVQKETALKLMESAGLLTSIVGGVQKEFSNTTRQRLFADLDCWRRLKNS